MGPLCCAGSYAALSPPPMLFFDSPPFDGNVGLAHGSSDKGHFSSGGWAALPMAPIVFFNSLFFPHPPSNGFLLYGWLVCCSLGFQVPLGSGFRSPRFRLWFNPSSLFFILISFRSSPPSSHTISPWLVCAFPK